MEAAVLVIVWPFLYYSQILQGWHVSSMYGKKQVISVTEEILSSLPFWGEMEETP